MHYLKQAVEGGLGAKKDCNWSNSALIDVKNPPSSWFEKQCLYEMLQDHRGVFPFFLFFSHSSSSSLNACTTLQSQQPGCKCFVSLMKAMMFMSDLGKQINKVNKSAM